MKKDVLIYGVDINPDLIKNCNELKQKLGFKNLKFYASDINTFKTEEKVDIVYSLHACDTATDLSIGKYVELNANLGFFVSCCHRQIAKQVKKRMLGDVLDLFDFKVFREKMGHFLTDLVRQKFLEADGSKVQIFEFTPVRWTDKNIMIRAMRTGKPRKEKIESYNKFIDKLKIKPFINRYHSLILSKTLIGDK